MDNLHKNILVAPLNWGLGHATRCIPIIQNLEKCGFTPLIASDGAASKLLKLEFPHLKHLTLPSYGITYPKNGKNFRWKMLQSLPNMILAAAKERKLVEKWSIKYQLSGIISDNRLGVYNPEITSILITHQLNVLTGFTTYFSTKLHQIMFKNFNAIWIPDVSGLSNLSGKLGHSKVSNPKIKYIGALSRFRKIDSDFQYDLMVLLSGPEPQRTFLEKKVIIELQNYSGKVIFVKGVVAEQQVILQSKNILFYNFMQSAELEKAMNESKLVLARSGYTTIMDLAKLGKKAFFIPTPGQFEQEYLAEKFNEDEIAPFCRQSDFKIEKLSAVENYSGFPTLEKDVDWAELFRFFDRK